ncbi:4-hydroxybenzoate polyprenyltransferase [Promicromonospora sp. AC04]|uniref:SCO3242 family prenyltransferase n=1 Tax=Promicromonospora sp. AC04 TaxID=2135723 RepID=UPI000D395E8B|nr:UbiA family prenyltransferase [Promicromonospora sp. AC04]PUB24303.1 4-hydroxybenzoate polyprenyltransferase [Promicromonospora sp. AC04]
MSSRPEPRLAYRSESRTDSRWRTRSEPWSQFRAEPRPRTPTFADLAELVRAPAALSVVGDTLAGLAAARAGARAAAQVGAHPGERAGAPVPIRGRHLLLPVASACLYLGGMALNDYADRHVDAVERPERPIPSGRVTPRAAIAIGAALTAGGVAAAGVAGGRRALGVAVPLAACVWTYDLVAKDRPAGPFVMAACRGLDVLLGATPGRMRSALPAAAGLTAHTLGVTVLSRGEVHGTTAQVAGVVAAGTIAGAVAAAATPTTTAPTARQTAARWTTVAAATAYAAACAPAQVRAAARPTAANARTATRSGIQAMVPLQAAWAARSGGLGTTALLAGVAAVGYGLRLLSRTRGRAGVSIT